MIVYEKNLYYNDAAGGVVMEIVHLQEFVELSKTLNFTAAAQRLFISQPALSKHIRALEGELGMALFERKGKAIRLTEFGRSYLRHAEAILEQYENAEKWDELREFAEKYGNRKTDFYYAPVDDIFRYADATKEVKIAEGKVTNPTSIEIYAEINGIRTTIAPQSSFDIKI